MTSLPEPSPPVKQDSAGERDLVLAALRVAASRSRLQTNLFDSIGTALRHKQIDCAGALEWLHDEGLLDLLPPFGPGVS